MSSRHTKYDVLDFIIETLLEHEKKIDSLISKLEEYMETKENECN